MDLDFSEEQQVLRDTVRKLCAEYSPVAVVRAMEDDPKGFPDALWKQLAELDLLGVLVPEEYGGLGENHIGAALIMDELARDSGPVSLSYGAHPGLCVGAIPREGSPAPKRRVLPRLCSGGAIGRDVQGLDERGRESGRRFTDAGGRGLAGGPVRLPCDRGHDPVGPAPGGGEREVLPARAHI